MKKILFIIITASLFIACDKTEDPLGIMEIFFGNSYEGNENKADGPITIKRIEFANVNNGALLSDWGKELYANQMRYLQIRILYDCNTVEQKSVTLYVKIINPDGNLRQGPGSPENYTFEQTFTSAGNRMKDDFQGLGGWGNSAGSVYTAGTYKVEIWEEEKESKMLFETTVQLR